MLDTKSETETEYLRKVAESLPLRMRDDQIIHVDFSDTLCEDFGFFISEVEHVFVVLNQDLMDDPTWILRQILEAIDLNLFEYPSSISRADFFKIQGLWNLSEIIIRLMVIRVVCGQALPTGAILNKACLCGWEGVIILSNLKKNAEFVKYGMNIEAIKVLISAN